MAFKTHGYLGRLMHQRALARWRQTARDANAAELTQLSQHQQMARQLQRPLQVLTEVAETRLALPRSGSTTFSRPSGTDWSWRPKPWRIKLAKHGLAPAYSKGALSNEMQIFHDCPLSQISLRQTRNTGADDLSPFAVRLDVLAFQGSYLSLVIEVPPSSCDGLRKRHLIRLGATIQRERPTAIHARLNIKHGPNTEQVMLTLPDDGEDAMVEFDLAYGQLNEKRAERMWIDLMIAAPTMNQITFRDLNLSRYPRADI